MKWVGETESAVTDAPAANEEAPAAATEETSGDEPSNVTEAKGWIGRWKAKRAAKKEAKAAAKAQAADADKPENVKDAENWIAKWKNKK